MNHRYWNTTLPSLREYRFGKRSGGIGSQNNTPSVLKNVYTNASCSDFFSVDEGDVKALRIPVTVVPL
jgi:hypothetical protein